MNVSGSGYRPGKVQFERAFRLLNKSFECFYEKKYETTVELCAESLGHLLPDCSSPPGSPLSPEEIGELFLKTYSSILPVSEADGIASVFTFFQSRKARFHFRQGKPLPDRDWWQFIRIGQEEAEEVVSATRLTLNTIEASLEQEE